MFFSKRLTHDVAFLIGVILLFFLLRFPSLYEPYWYGDEGIYFAIGKAMHAGQTLYLDIWDNKPPLLYWFYFLFNDIFSIRFASIIAGILATISFFNLSRSLFQKKYLTYAATLIFAIVLGLPTIEGNIANAENFMLFPVITGVFLFWNAQKKADSQAKQAMKQFLFSGLCIGIAFLFKTVAAFDFATILCAALILITLPGKTSSLSVIAKQRLFPLLIGFFVPLLLVGLLMTIQGALPIFLETLFLKNVSYVGENNELFFPQGFLFLKMLLLLSGVFLLFIFRRLLQPKMILILLWLVFSLFSVFFSQRPYTHYQLVILPSLLLAVMCIPDVLKRNHKILLGIVSVITFLLLYNMFPHWNAKKTVQYYENFFAFVSGKRDVTDYQRFFDNNTPRDYAVADYLSLHTEPNDKVFLWGNSAQIYYLSDTLPAGRYSVAYHIITPDAVSETAAALQKEKPEFLVFLPGTEPFPLLTPDYTYRATIGDAHIYEKLF